MVYTPLPHFKQLTVGLGYSGTAGTRCSGKRQYLFELLVRNPQRADVH